MLLDNKLFNIILFHEYQPILLLLKLNNLLIQLILSPLLILRTNRLKWLLLHLKLEAIVPILSGKLQNIIRLLLVKAIRNQTTPAAVVRAHLVGQGLRSRVNVLQNVDKLVGLDRKVLSEVRVLADFLLGRIKLHLDGVVLLPSIEIRQVVAAVA